LSAIQEVLEELREIDEKYELPNRIDKFLEEIEEERVCVPLIGQFSSGKSRALNTLLGYSNLLTVDIVPETATPTELCYPRSEKSLDTVDIILNNGSSEVIPLETYLKSRRDSLVAKETAHVSMQLNNSVLKALPRLCIVDMPGFGSGIDVHDKAINNYAVNSMAYIVAFPANELTMTTQIGDALKELCVLNKPICVMITKEDIAPPEKDYKAMQENLKDKLKRYIGEDREVELLYTSSKSGDVSDLKNYLVKLHEQSEQLLREQKHIPFLKTEAGDTLAYLKGRLAKNDLSESELAEEEARIRREMTECERRMTSRTSRFRADAAYCAESIIGEARSALHQNMETYVSLAINKGDLSSRINSDVRLAVNEGAQQRFVPLAQSYVEDMAAELSSMDELTVNPHGLTTIKDSNLIEALSSGALTAGLAGTIATTLGLKLGTLAIGAVAIPVIGIAIAVAGVIGSIIGGLVSSAKKREEAKNTARQALASQVFPDVMGKVEPMVKKAISDKTEEITEAIESRVKDRYQTLERSLADTRAGLEAAKEEKAEAAATIGADIAKIERLLHDI